MEIFKEKYIYFSVKYEDYENILLANVKCICLGNRKEQIIFNRENIPAIISELNSYVSNKENSIVVWDSVESFLFFARYNIIVNCSVYDPKIALYLLDEERKSIDFKEFTGIKFSFKYSESKDTIKKECLSCLNLFHDIYGQIKKECLIEIYKILSKSSYYLAEMRYEGINFDSEKAKQYLSEKENIYLRLEKEIKKEIGNVSIGNTEKLSKYLQEKYGIADNGTSNIEIHQHANIQIVRNLLDFRRICKEIEALENPIKRVKESQDGKLHITYRHETLTGRLRSDFSTPLKDAWYRELFVAGTGNVFICSDYKYLDISVIANSALESNIESGFYNLISSGKDPHLDMAEKLSKSYGIEINRDLGKQINYAISFGLSAQTFAQKNNIDINSAKNYFCTYNREHPEVKVLINKCLNEIIFNGFVRTIFGFKRRVRNYDNILWQATKMFTAKTQGSEGQIGIVAMMNLIDYLRANGERAFLQINGHDEILVKTRSSFDEKSLPELSKIINNVGNLKCKLKSKIGVGKNWNEAKINSRAYE